MVQHINAACPSWIQTMANCRLSQTRGAKSCMPLLKHFFYTCKFLLSELLVVKQWTTFLLSELLLVKKRTILARTQTVTFLQLSFLLSEYLVSEVYEILRTWHAKHFSFWINVIQWNPWQKSTLAGSSLLFKPFFPKRPFPSHFHVNEPPLPLFQDPFCLI